MNSMKSQRAGFQVEVASSGVKYPSLPAIRAREGLLLAACRRAAALHRKGMNLVPAWRRVAAEYHGRALPGGKTFLCSYGTLVRWWYRSSGGQNPAGFRDGRYLHRGESKLPQTVIVGLNHYALTSGLTVRGIFNSLGGSERLGISYPHLCRFIGDAVKQAKRKRQRVQRLCVVLDQKNGTGGGYAKNGKGHRRRAVKELGGKGAGRRMDAVREGALAGDKRRSAGLPEKAGMSNRCCGGVSGGGGAGAPVC